MVGDNRGDDLHGPAVFHPIHFCGSGQSRGAGEGVPIKPRRRSEGGQRLAIVTAIVGDVRARNPKQRVDGGLDGPAFSRQIVLEPSCGPRPVRLGKDEDSQSRGRHMLQHIGATNKISRCADAGRSGQRVAESTPNAALLVRVQL